MTMSETPRDGDAAIPMGHLLNENSFRLMDYLDAVLSSALALQTELRMEKELFSFWDITRIVIARLMPFNRIGFAWLDESGLDCALKYWHPMDAQQAMKEEMEHLIDMDFFGWAWSQNRPVVAQALEAGCRAVLYPLAGRGRDYGMFIGVTSAFPLPDILLKMLSIILVNCAHAIENMELYAELQQYNRNLEDMVAKRTRELIEANRQLQIVAREANRLALEAGAAGAAKTEFLSNMSHEIRTPMNSVLGMTELLLSTPLNQEQQEYAGMARNSATELLDMLSNILELADIEAGKATTTFEEFSLPAVIKDAGKRYETKAAEKGLRFQCDIAPDVPTAVRSDPALVRRVLGNLLDNAVKFTSEGSVSLSIFTESRRNDWVVVRFLVEDTGVGIPRDKQQVIFEPFAQVDASFTRQFGGSGLGLCITKRLVELLNGHIGVESKVGRGSRFWFSVKMIVPSASRAPAANGAALAGNCILLADPNENNRQVLTQMLNSWSCACAGVADSAAALEALEKHAVENRPFDAMIVSMTTEDPEMIALGNLIKNDALLSGTVLVLLAPEELCALESRWRAMGFRACIKKPVRPEGLYQCLCDVVGEKKKPEAKLRTPSSRTGARALVAETNLTTQAQLLETLHEKGFSVDVAENVEEIIAALQNQAYQLAIMEGAMVRQDNFELVRRIRDMESGSKNPDIPIIALITRDMNEERARWWSAGVSGIIEKPMDKQRLLDAVADIIGHQMS